MRSSLTTITVCLALLVVVATAQNSSSSTGGSNSTKSSTGHAVSSSTGSAKPKNVTDLSDCNKPPYCLGPLLNSTTIYLMYNNSNTQCGQDHSRAAYTWYYEYLGDSPPICINLNMRRKAWFFPTVDTFSVMQLVHSFNTTLGAGINGTGTGLTWLMYPDFVFRVEAGGFATDWQYVWKPSRDPLNPYVLPYATVIVTLQDGQISSLDWDDGGCSLMCSSDACMGGPQADGSSTDDRFCGIQVQGCGFNDTASAYFGNFTFPNLYTQFSGPIYIGWKGTDVNGQFMTSSGTDTNQDAKMKTSSASSSAPAASPKSTYSKTKAVVTTTHDFEGKATVECEGIWCMFSAGDLIPDQLAFKKGETLTILDKSAQQGRWWKALNSDGRVGYIPANYVSEGKKREFTSMAEHREFVSQNDLKFRSVMRPAAEVLKTASDLAAKATPLRYEVPDHIWKGP